MKIKGQIDIRCSRDGVVIVVRDKDATIAFAEIEMTPTNFVAALGNLAHVDCEIEVAGLDKIGKIHENKRIEFEIPKDLYYARRNEKDELLRLAKSACPEGWSPDNHFSSQDSFFTKDDKWFARVTIRRWVDKAARGK